MSTKQPATDRSGHQSEQRHTLRALHGELDEEKVVDDGNESTGRIEERNEQQAGRSQAACEGDDLLLPTI